MRLHIACSLVTMTLVLPEGSVAQRFTSDREGVEVAAARMMLYDDTATKRVAINDRFGAADEAPSVRDLGRRPASRNAELARLVGATVRNRHSTISCVELQCALLGTDLLLTISEPMIVGESATVTVTAERVSRRRIAYVTNRFHLVRERGAWRIERTEQLGIS